MIRQNCRIFFLESSRNLGGQELQLIQQMICLMNMGIGAKLICQTNSPIGNLAKLSGLNVVTTSLKKGLDLIGIYDVLKNAYQDSPTSLIVHSGHDSLIGGLAAKVSSLMMRDIQVIRMRTYQPNNKKASSVQYNYLFNATYTPSAFLRSKILENRRIKPKKIAVLYPGINFNLLDQNQNAPDFLLNWLSSRPGPILSHGAMLRGEKGHQIILQALPEILKSFPDVRYVIAGDGPQLELLKKIVHDKHLEEHVFFAGLIQPISSLLKISTLALMPSLREPLGMFQIESQYLRVPTLASNVDGIPETLIHQKTGLLVEPGNVEEWSKQVCWALNNIETMRGWAENGCKFVQEKFSMESNTQQLLKILDLES